MNPKKKNLPAAIVSPAFALLWLINQSVQPVIAGSVALALLLFHGWLFPRQASPYVSTENDFTSAIEKVGWPGFAALTIANFLVLKVVRRLLSRDQEERVSLVEESGQAALKEKFGDTASMLPDGPGYTTTVVCNGKQFLGTQRIGRLKMRGIEVSTATALVTLQIADHDLEMRIAQKAFWFSPKTEPLSIVPKDEVDLVDSLNFRYDCSSSERRKIEEFIADPDVQKELLPKYPNANERSTLTISKGEVRVECVAETKYERSVGEAATSALMQKLLKRAAIFDRRLTEMEADRV